MKHIKKMKIDIDKKNFEVIPSVQYDRNTRYLHINLLNGSVPFNLTGCSVKISGTKSDGTAIFNNCTVINAKEGFIEVELTEQMNAAPGILKCELKLYNGKGVLTTKHFHIDVTASVISKGITSSNEFKALTDALKVVQGIENKADKEKVEEKFGEVYEHLDNNNKQIKSVINLNLFPRLKDDTSDAERIQRAIDYSIQLLQNGSFGSHKILEFPSGEYIIDKTVQIPIFIRFKSIGNVVFVSKVKGVMFKIYTPTELNIENIIREKWDHVFSLFKGSVLNGLDGGFTLARDKSVDRTETIAIEIGNPIQNEGKQNFTGWWFMNDICIANFGIGIRFNANHNFLGKLDRILFADCKIGVEFFATNVYNSGENIGFNNCIFGDTETCININGWSDLELVCNGCSFDFTNIVLKTSLYGVYKFTDSHFEGIGFTNTMEETVGELGLVISNAPASAPAYVFIDSCDVTRIRGNIFKSTHQNGLQLFINSFTTKGSDGFNELFAICDDNVDVVNNNFIPCKYLHLVTQNKLNVKCNPNFENLEIGTQITNDYVTDGYMFTYDMSGRSTIVNEITFNNASKSLKIDIPEGGLWTQIKSEEFSCRTGDKILNLFHWYTKSDSTNKLGKMSITTTFYDKDGKALPYPTIDIEDGGSIASYSTNNEWNRPIYFEQLIAPQRAVKFIVTYTINPPSTCTLYLGGFYTTIY